MIEWTIIIILGACLSVAVHLLRNLFKTLGNIQAQLFDLHSLVQNYNELVKKINDNETYYGDPIIEAFVKMSNEINESFEVIHDIQNELNGDLNDEKENEA